MIALTGVCSPRRCYLDNYRLAALQMLRGQFRSPSSASNFAWHILACRERSTVLLLLACWRCHQALSPNKISAGCHMVLFLVANDRSPISVFRSRSIRSISMALTSGTPRCRT